MIFTFGGQKVEIKKLRLVDADELYPYVGSAMMQLNLGNFGFFSDLKPKDINLMREKMCKYVLKMKEQTQDDGSIQIVKENLSLSDFQEHLSDFLPLLAAFLEFNFGFFSKAQKILEPILTKESESIKS